MAKRITAEVMARNVFCLMLIGIVVEIIVMVILPRVGA